MPDTLAELWNRNARYNGDRLATVSGERRIPFKLLFDRATQLGNALARFGLRKHDRVAMLAMNRHEWFEVYGACHLSALIVATVNFRLAPPEEKNTLLRTYWSIPLRQKETSVVLVYTR